MGSVEFQVQGRTDREIRDAARRQLDAYAAGDDVLWLHIRYDVRPGAVSHDGTVTMWIAEIRATDDENADVIDS